VALAPKIKERIYRILYTPGGPFVLQLLLNVSASLKNVIYYCYKSVNTNCMGKREELLTLRLVALSHETQCIPMCHLRL
jgi:hypothetical protein